MTFDLSAIEAENSVKWRRRMSAEDPKHAANFCPEGDCNEYVGVPGMQRHRSAAHPDSSLVGPEKTIRKGRAGNMDDDRLLRRREYLAYHLGQGRTGNSDDSRLGFALKAGEMSQVEGELRARSLITSEQRVLINPKQFGY